MFEPARCRQPPETKNKGCIQREIKKVGVLERAQISSHVPNAIDVRQKLYALMSKATHRNLARRHSVSRKIACERLRAAVAQTEYPFYRWISFVIEGLLAARKIGTVGKLRALRIE